MSPSTAQVEVAFNVCSRDLAAQQTFQELLQELLQSDEHLVDVFNAIDTTDMDTRLEDFVHEMAGVSAFWVLRRFVLLETI